MVETTPFLAQILEGLIAQKVIKITCSFFLTFNKIELGIFCQKIKVIGLIWAFLRPFFQLDLKNPKMKKCLFRG